MYDDKISCISKVLQYSNKHGVMATKSCVMECSPDVTSRNKEFRQHAWNIIIDDNGL